MHLPFGRQSINHSILDQLTDCLDAPLNSHLRDLSVSSVLKSTTVPDSTNLPVTSLQFFLLRRPLLNVWMKPFKHVRHEQLTIRTFAHKVINRASVLLLKVDAAWSVLDANLLDNLLFASRRLGRKVDDARDLFPLLVNNLILHDLAADDYRDKLVGVSDLALEAFPYLFLGERGRLPIAVDGGRVGDID